MVVLKFIGMVLAIILVILVLCGFVALGIVAVLLIEEINNKTTSE